MNSKSKKSTGKNNFYLAIINALQQSKKLTEIQKDLNLTKQNLRYYLRQLCKEGYLFQKGRGWYELTDKSKNLTKYDKLLNPDISRGHAFILTVKLPKEIKGWDNRAEILKQKGIHFNLVGALKTTPRIKVLGRKVWLCNDTLRIFEKKENSYYGENAVESRKLAFMELFHVIKAIESKLGVTLRPFEWEFRREHYALIKNGLAIEHNRKGEILRISDEEGEWLLVDDSLGEGGELETIGKRALQNNVHLQRWWNDQKNTKFEVTPSFILQTMNGIQKNQVVFDKNMASHLEVLKNIGESQRELAETIRTLREEIKNLKERQ